ncbi:unnamed protein product [Ilex paraguariensis]|uniref:Glycolipid transfer protein domain-containing protein n=1 Tax=Ilex paraguariensis TaxID=185542 RepID=A0ABC8T1H5_9AQUA
MESGSEIRSAIEELSMVVVKVIPGGDDQSVAHIPAKPFLSLCDLIIQRLEKFQESDPALYSNMVEILKKEASEGNARKRTSCSSAIVWLTRSMDFTVALLQLLVKDFDLNMEQAVQESYNITLKPWHGWICSTAYRVALKLLPDNKTLVSTLMAKDEDYEKLKGEMQALISLIVPLLEDIHSILITSSCGYVLVYFFADKIGPTLTVLRQDIHQNIQRLEKFQESDPALYSNMVEILKKEASEGNARKRTSCSSAIVWLTRSMDFTVALLQLLVKDFDLNMEQAVQESYNITLKPWHGWICSTAYRVALKLLPDNKTLVSTLMAKDEDYEKLKGEMQALISLIVPLLEDIHSILRLEKFQESDPALYSNMVEILKKETSEGNARKRTSCSSAIVWLTRSMDFTVALLQLLVKDFDLNMEQAVQESYNITLKPWHGWICSTAYRVALKLLPDNKTLVSTLMAKDEDYEKLKGEMQALISLIVPLLEDIHSILGAPGKVSTFSRSMDFTVALLQLLVKDFDLNMEQAVQESYNITLKPWHGWICSTAYRVALKLLPDNKTLVSTLMAKDEDYEKLKGEMQALISLILPLLEDIHSILRTYGLDRLKSI